MTMTKGMILNLSSNADVFARGEKYYRDGKLLAVKAEEKNGQTIVKASVEGNYKNYDVTLQLEPGGAIKHYTCSCESHSIWRGACKHVVAVLFDIAENRVTQDPHTPIPVSRTLTDTLERLIFNEIDASLTLPQTAQEGQMHLAPCFHYDTRGETYLSFTIGQDRMYVIKSLPNFLQNIRRGETAGYGRGLQFTHSPGVFDGGSRRLLEFLLREDGIYQEIAKKVNSQFQYMLTMKNNARHMLLSERSMDEFFNLYADEEIDGQIEGETRVRLLTALPDIRFHVKMKGGAVALTADRFDIRVKNGLRCHYFITKNIIYRVEKNDALILINILKTLSASSRTEITFQGTERQRFFSVVLPRLVRLGVVDGTEDMPVLPKAEMRSKLYFDYENRDVLCRVTFHYGDAILEPEEQNPRFAAEANTTQESAQTVLTRDPVGEYTIKKRLAVMGFTANEAKGACILSDNDLIYALLHDQAGLQAMKEHAEVFVSDALDKKALKTKIAMVGVRLQGNLLDVSFTGADYTLADLLEALESYRAKKKFHRLRDGRFMPLEGDEVVSAAGLVDALDISRRDVHGNTITVPAYRALYVDTLLKETPALPLVKGNEAYDELISRFNAGNRDETGKSQPEAAVQALFPLPKTLTSILREYQKYGFQWLKTLAHYGFGGILADDMGLGKTLEVIAVLLSSKARGIRSLVVAPTSLLYNWDNEIKRFAPALRTEIISGLPEKRRESLTAADADVLITTYDMMKRDVAYYEDMTFAYIIADEAQNIKNPSTQNARAIKRLNGRVRYALTGTPIENSLTELWSIFDFIMPGYLHSAHKFARLYETPIVKDNDTSRAARLRGQIAPFVLRRIKKNVLTELPDKTETTLLADLADEQRKIYLAYLMQARGEFDDLIARDGFASNRMRILAQLTRLRQICCHPALFMEKYAGGSGKLDMALETIQMAVESGHRALLFSQFTAMLDILRAALDESPFSYFYLDGATRAQDRISMTSRFNAGERDLFLISLKAGGTGLNLIGADVVLHYDPWWNPSVMDQASDRAHRYGQEKAVQIFNIVAKDTIEEKIIALQEKKRGLIDAVITEGGSFINALTEDEVRELFAGV
jgi:superfamily II DNA or RNA helicase